MIRRLLFFIVVASLLSEDALAYSLTEANEHLNLARTYMANSDNKNALKNAHLARRIYENYSRTDSVETCDELISQIQDSLTPRLLADRYFAIAADYFLMPDENNPNPTVDIEMYELTKYFAREALNIYGKITGTTGVFKAEDLIDRSSREILKVRNTERSKADSLLSESRTLYIREEFKPALLSAQNATVIYENISDISGIKIARETVNKISNRIFEIEQNARTTMQNAQRLYGEGNMTNALTLAETAKNLYTLIDDEPRMEESNSLLSLIHQSLDTQVTNKKRLAEEFIQQAEQNFVLGNFETATENVFNAKDIYLEFFKEAKKGSSKADYYGDLIQEANILGARISRSMGEEQTKKSAESYYNRAQEFFIAGQTNEALTYVRRAKDLYTSVDAYVGVEKSNALLLTITDRVSRNTFAEGNLSMAFANCYSADFESARISLGMANQIYLTLLGTNKSAELDNVSECIESGEEKKVDARVQFEKAFEFYQDRDYRKANKNAKTAYDIYESINYSLGMQEAGSLLEKAESEVKRLNSRLRLTVISIAIVAVLAAILIINFMKKNREMVEIATREKEERQKSERLDKKKWEVEKEEATEEKVKEELKMIIEKERGRIDKNEISEDI